MAVGSCTIRGCRRPAYCQTKCTGCYSALRRRGVRDMRRHRVIRGRGRELLVTDAQIERARKLRGKGLTQPEIIERLSLRCSQSTVSRALAGMHRARK